MKSQKISTIRTSGSKAAASFRPLATAREGELRRTDQETINSIFGSIGQKLREGRSRRPRCFATATNHQHTDDDLANLKRLLAFTLETVGKYKESLDTVKHYENDAVLARLSPETKIRVITQLAISYNNLGDHPKAVTLLKETYERAKVQDFHHLIGAIETGLARVYRKLNECPISRDHAERGLAAMRDQGDWLGMAEAYREIALSYHQEGNSEKSVEYFDLGVQIIGDRSSVHLGKLTRSVGRMVPSRHTTALRV